MSKFKAGDVVELNSGGPVMTILEVKNNGWVVCEWFDKNHTYNKKEFFGIEYRYLRNVRGIYHLI